jgi:hypothetical protein
VRVVRGETDLRDRITVEVDPSADPVDWDAALAKFLLAFVRKQAISTVGTAAAEPVDHNTSTTKER